MCEARSARGAGPCGRGSVARARPYEREARLAETLLRPGSESLKTISAAPSARLQDTLLPCRNEQGRRDSHDTLDHQRRLREQTACVPPIRRALAARRAEGRARRSALSRPELDRRPVVVRAAEGNRARHARADARDGVMATRTATSHGAVARTMPSSPPSDPSARKSRRALVEDEVGVLFTGSRTTSTAGTDDVKAAARAETPSLETCSCKSLVACGSPSGRHERHENQLARGRGPGERLREGEQRIGNSGIRRYDDDRPVRSLGLHRRVEGRVVLENRVLKLLESGPRLDAELFDERLSRRLVRRQRLGLTARAVEGEHQRTSRGVRGADAPRSAARAPARRDDRPRGRRRFASRAQ